MQEIGAVMAIGGAEEERAEGWVDPHTCPLLCWGQCSFSP